MCDDGCDKVIYSGRGPRVARNKLLAFWVYYGTGIAIYAPLIVPTACRTWRGNEISWDVFLLWYLTYAFAILLAFVITLGRIRGHCRLCWSLELAAERTGKTADDLKRLIVEQNIEPLYTMDGIPLYEPSQLTEAALLLRPAGNSGDDTLLRVASGNGSESDMLVRAVDVVGPSRLAIPEREAVQVEQ